MVLRVIPTKILSVDDLLLPPVLRRISDEERGLVLVTGTTGSGKSTTLAAMIDHVNRSHCSHIMTVEDPVVSQRLIPRADVSGRGPAVEVLIATAFIRDCVIDKEKTHLINSAIAQGISTTADSARDEMARAVTGGGGSEIPGLTRFGG